MHLILQITSTQLLLLVRERSTGLYPGFATAVNIALDRGFVEISQRCTRTIRVPCDLILTTTGHEAIKATGCNKKTAFITRDVYCAKHGRKAGWPCREAVIR